MKIKQLDLKNFRKDILEEKKTVLVDFYADWCGPCKMMSKVFEEISGEVDGISFGKVNIDSEEELALEYEIFSVPTFALFKDGKLMSSCVGVSGKQKILDMLSDT